MFASENGVIPLAIIRCGRGISMLKVGLTGGIGCGKSTAVHYFKEYDVSVIDADVIAKELVEPGEPALQEIATYLGNQYIQEDGQLNRALLKQEAFSDSTLLIKLEAILHPLIRDEIKSLMDEVTSLKGSSVVNEYLIVDIPLLVEKGYEDLFDKIIVVTCSKQQQLERIKERDSLVEAAIKSIMNKQATEKERLAIATETLDNKGSKEALAKQVEALHLRLLESAHGC